MRISRYPTEQEWAEIVKEGPGVRMYNGKRTLFYNGEILRDVAAREWLIYNKEERETWQCIIVLPGVEIIPEWTFRFCKNVEVVIMPDTVRTIKMYAFYCCYSLLFVNLSTDLEYIGRSAFYDCKSLTSIFIPPRCREIGIGAFRGCNELIIFSVPPNTRIGRNVFVKTELFEVSPFEVDRLGHYRNIDQVNAWVRDINASQEYALHRACCSFNPLFVIIYQIVRRNGLQAFKVPNRIDITPSQYLEANPFAQVDQKEIINKYIVEMMGETV
ncbi:hypothetical protein CTEN210_18441 [Chaetoceros tenuissimus]|uniref:Leucine-rich repeat domain-containing protein n=1 Tax=Chaetoceros tenuissimus TaxID=426638 RepID=A0AAD3DEL4_9STRA|nr:hypothetical protein CTEN210_18441 [Chaetoceros tenuissimus]